MKWQNIALSSCYCEPFSNLQSSLHAQSPYVNYSDSYMVLCQCVLKYDTQKWSIEAVEAAAFYITEYN